MGAGAGKPVGPQGQQSQGGINGVIQQAMQNSQPQAHSIQQAASNVWRNKGLLGPNAPQVGIGALPGMVHGMWERQGFVDNRQPMPMSNLQGSPLPPTSQSQAMMTPMGAPQTPPPGGMPQGYAQAFNQFQPQMPPQGNLAGGPLPPPMDQSQAMQGAAMGAPQDMEGQRAFSRAQMQNMMSNLPGGQQMPPPQMPVAPNVQQTRMEDPRMMAMRRMQRMRGM